MSGYQGTSFPRRSFAFVLLDADIKAMGLSGTPLQILAAPGPGFMWVLHNVIWFCNFAAGAYGNLQATWVIGITTGLNPASMAASGLTTPTMTNGWNTAMAAAAKNMVFDSVDFATAGGTFIADNQLDNQAIYLLLENNANPITGGGAGNRLTLTFDAEIKPLQY